MTMDSEKSNRPSLSFQQIADEVWFASNIPSLYPPAQADYPIYFVAGPGGSGILVPGQLVMRSRSTQVKPPSHGKPALRCLLTRLRRA